MPSCNYIELLKNSKFYLHKRNLNFLKHMMTVHIIIIATYLMESYQNIYGSVDEEISRALRATFNVTFLVWLAQITHVVVDTTKQTLID